VDSQTKEGALMSGCYVQVSPQQASKNILSVLLEGVAGTETGIEVTSVQDLHVTVIYSRTSNEHFHAERFNTAKFLAKIKCIERWEDTSEGHIAVALLSAPGLDEHQRILLARYGFTFDYDRYRPHITLMKGVISDAILEALNKDLVDIHMILEDEQAEELDEGTDMR
jgi:2'-5' RNA ligase